MANQDQIIDQDKMDSKSAIYLKDFTEHRYHTFTVITQSNGLASEFVMQKRRPLVTYENNDYHNPF